MSRSARWLQILGLGALAAGLPGLDAGAPLSWLAAGLLLLAALKLIEARQLRERRLVSLLTLIGCGVQGVLQPELGPSLLQLLATSLALAGLLALELGTGLSWRAVLRRTLAVLLAALPVALVLFLLVPRLGPLWPVPNLRGPGSRAVTGLSPVLDPGRIASLANDTAPAARVRFSTNRPPGTSERYWRVLVHQQFDGASWQQIAPLAAPLAPAQAGGASQLWLVEASPVSALPWDGTGWSSQRELQSSASGELQRRPPSQERQGYLLRGTGEPQAWQRRPPTPADLALPLGRNPRLEALGAQWRALPTPQQRLAAAQAWWAGGGFRYTRTPGALPAQGGLDVFLFERREGFCGHYASAFTALMRAAGVPARVVSGYLGGTWVQPLGGSPYLDLRRSDAHAWSEVWLPDQGWQRVDPSRWAAATGNAPERGARSWWQWLQWQWWGLDLAWSGWWLGFDQAAQEALLQGLFGSQRQGLGAVVLVAVAALLAMGLAWLQGGQQRRPGDPWRRELQAVVRQLQGWGLDPQPGETFEQLCRRASQRYPATQAVLAELVHSHNQLRYARLSPEQRSQRWTAWRTARRALRNRPKTGL